ncbi:putative transcriptional regulatory protein [Steroidobacter agaridevorans]|uniref:Putative transcriptional regulatory protein n=1 Tax=Steroidobacter agaridevorans TaxID=2695856 RepID=A0A829YAW0_9GAMM|nr:AraC family transcriptional regulator [Steroidobacter agaridevorans]GFE79762.1 putative transcriptional regulatory protein [Steroidobacter agaridevorans]
MSTESGAATVRVDGLRKFPELVTRLGGNPRTLLTKSQIDPTVLHNRHAVIPYRSLVMLLERSAHELNCPDFGMRLAMAQGGLKVLGPLEFAMRNSGTIREAFQYCASHPQVYSTASQMRFETSRAPDALFLRFEILLHRLPPHAQAIERALLLTQLVTLDISRDRIRAREIWLTHDPLVPEDRYREHFGVNVRFRQPVNGLFFANSDLDMPIPNIDAQLYELTTDFIENRFPSASAPLSTRVRTIIERLLIQGDCNYGSVSATLGMHPRTLQRRLRAENESFESIKDSVRREVALRYLKQSSLPLIRVAKLLGYSETSALSRSCYRWFSASPRQLRSGVDMMNGDDLRTKQSA